MKSISALIIITVLALVALAQRAENNTDEALKARNAPDVFVYTASASGSDGKRSSSFTIEVGNNGTKGISAIEWEYDSPEAVAGHGDHLRFRSGDLKIRPEERKKLTKEVQHYTPRFVAGFSLSAVRLMRVEYDDGSVWQRPTDDK
jgi:hypothetical protein